MNDVKPYTDRKFTRFCLWWLITWSSLLGWTACATLYGVSVFYGSYWLLTLPELTSCRFLYAGAQLAVVVADLFTSVIFLIVLTGFWCSFNGAVKRWLDLSSSDSEL